jgi:hypothetical protein
MSRGLAKHTTFTHAAARFRDLVYVAATDNVLAARDIAHARFIGFDDGKFAHLGDRGWQVAGICAVTHPAQKLVAVGEGGEVFTYVQGTVSDEVIRPQPRCLRGAAAISGHAYAFGMGYEMYRRAGERVWTPLPGVPAGVAGGGFEAVAGVDESDIYAVGWSGQIWHRDGTAWHQLPSPAGLILTGVTLAPDGTGYACGQAGTLLTGRHDAWHAIDTAGVTDDLWGVQWHDGRLYAASPWALYTLTSAGLRPVGFRTDAPSTCGMLTAADGVLWSVGSGDVYCLTGDRWQRIE